MYVYCSPYSKYVAIQTLNFLNFLIDCYVIQKSYALAILSFFLLFCTVHLKINNQDAVILHAND